MAKIIRAQKQPVIRPLVPPKPAQSMDTSVLLAALFQQGDPSWADLHRIIKRKEGQSRDYPLQDASLPDFSVPGKSTALFSDDEKAVIRLEALVKNRESEIRFLKSKLTETEKNAHQKGLNEGLQQGLQQGYGKAKQEMDRRMTVLEQQSSTALKAVESAKDKIFKIAEKEIMDLVMAYLRKIVSVETATNPEVIGAVAKKALQYLGETQRITVRVHPEDAQKVKAELPLWISVNKNLRQMAVEEDSRIGRGGCVIDTDAGQIDARLETQLKNMEEFVRRAWEGVQ